MTAMYIFLGVFGFFFIFGVPVVIALGMSGLFLLVSNGIGLTVFAQQWLMATDSYPLTAIFFFMLAGEIMNKGGLTRRIMGLAAKLVGNAHGGLAMIVGLGSMFFSAINGSAIATSAAVGSMMVPAMIEKKYPPDFTGAVVAAGGVVGAIIPPSIPIILYGTITGVSISKLFAGGIGLGVLIVGGQIAVSYLICKKNGWKGGSDQSMENSKGAVWALLLPVFILVTITFGILTATEAAAFSVVYAFLVSKLAYNELKINELPKLLEKAFVSTSSVMAIVGAASVTAWILTAQQVPQTVAAGILTICKTQTQFLLLTFIILILLGAVIDLTPAVLILAPVFILPVQQMGVDPVFFGIFFVSLLVTGLITPPVGTLIFTSCSMTKCSFTQITRQLVPYMGICFGMILLSIFFPQIITFIPSFIK